jgi:hypothetical protein
VFPGIAKRKTGEAEIKSRPFFAKAAAEISENLNQTENFG